MSQKVQDEMQTIVTRYVQDVKQANEMQTTGTA
jgi:hypothetical protein